MKKQLPVREPIADAYTHMGMEFSLFTTNEQYYPWLINNYIQIYSLKDMHLIPERTGTLDFFYNMYGDWEMFHFMANPYIETEKISYSTLGLILKKTSLEECIIYAIDRNKYVYVPIDMYALPIYGSEEQKHRVHHVFIIGYDTDREVFLAYDTYSGGKYRCVEISFTDITTAYNTLVSDPEVSGWSEIGGVCFFRLRMNPWQEDKNELFGINLNTIISGISEYLLLPGYGESYKHITHFRYGVDCYIDLESWLSFGLDSSQDIVDYRAFSAMRDHKKVMIFRMQYLQKYFNYNWEQYIIEYELIKQRLDLIIHKIIKGNFSKNKSQYQECMNLLREVRSREITALSAFLQDIKSS